MDFFTTKNHSFISHQSLQYSSFNRPILHIQDASYKNEYKENNLTFTDTIEVVIGFIDTYVTMYTYIALDLPVKQMSTIHVHM